MQELALVLLVFQDEVDALLRKRDENEAAVRAKVELVKAALVASRQEKLYQMFPELAPESVEPTATNTELLPSSEARRIEAMLAKAIANDSGSLTFDDLRPANDETKEGWIGWDG